MKINVTNQCDSAAIIHNAILDGLLDRIHDLSSKDRRQPNGDLLKKMCELFVYFANRYSIEEKLDGNSVVSFITMSGDNE